VKILQVARQFYPATGGVERFTMDLSRHLQRRGYPSDVLTLNRGFNRPGTLPNHEIIEGLRVFRIPFWGTGRIFIAPGVLNYLSGYDLIHIHDIDFFSDFLLLTKPYHTKPVVLSTHGGYFHTRRLALIKKIYFYTMTSLLLRRADQVIVDGFHDYDIFAPLVPMLRLIQNGVDYSHLKDVHKNIVPGLMVYIGRLAHNKRLDNLLRSFAIVCESVPDASLVLVGRDFDNLEKPIEVLAHNLGVAQAVKITGEVSENELADWLSRAHIFVSASEYEAFGISVLEAMSTGTISVVNSIRSFQDFIQDGQSGFLTNFANPNEAAQTIVRVLQMRSEELSVLGHRAKESAARFDWDKKVESFIEVYQGICGQTI